MQPATSVHLISSILAICGVTCHGAILHVDAKAGGANTGNSWVNAFTTLQAALQAAGSGDTVRIAEGIYVPDEGPGQRDGDPESTFEIPDKVVIEGGYPSGGGAGPDASQHLTILSGDLGQDDHDPDRNGIIDSPDDQTGRNAYQVVRIPAAADVTIQGVVVTAGHADGVIDSGGGIFVGDTGKLTLAGCWISGNGADTNGGGLSGSKVFLEMVGCRFTGNAAGGLGGAIHNSQGELGMNNVVMIGNLADTGGALACMDQAATIRSSSFSGNSAANGGGALFFSGAVVELKNTIIWGNIEDGDAGSPDSSLTPTGGSTVNYESCLLQGITLTDPQGYDGTDSGNAPLFHLPPDPSDAPSSTGDLRLLPSSPGIDKGLNSATSEVIDLAGNPRKIGVIDLGAYEFQRALFVDDTATGSQHGGSWENAFVNIHQALDIVRSGWTIHVARGRYYPDEGPGQSSNAKGSTFQLINQVSLLGGYPDGGNGARNPGSHPTILSGDLQQNDNDPDGNGISSGPADLVGTNARHVVTGSGADSSAVLDGFVITGGDATFTTPDRGAGLFIDNGSPTIRSCRFIGNHAALYGGAVSITGATSQPLFRDCEFLLNVAADSFSPEQGGAVYCGVASTPSFFACEFRGNRAGHHGGAVALGGSASATMENCLFSGNRATHSGGAIFTLQATLDLAGCTFSANGTAAPGKGGAVYNAISHVDADNTVMWNNAAGASNSSSGSSYAVEVSIGSTDSFNHCLIQGRNPSGTGNLTGLDPLFHINATAFGNPHLDGDFHLSTGSPLLAAGNHAAASETTDLDGEPRIQAGFIEIGAYEGSSPNPDGDNDGMPDAWEFAHTSPPSTTALDPDSDDDNDGFSALAEYAFGLDPNVPNGTGSASWWTRANSGGTDYPGLGYIRGPGVEAHVKFIVEHSGDLGDDDPWSAGPVVQHSGGGAVRTFRGTRSIASEARQFLRLRIEKIEPLF